MKHYSDALWWTLVTTTTVGYGDIVPVTLLGKFIGACLMLGGIGIVSLITGNISHVLTTRNNTVTEQPIVPLHRFDTLNDEAKQRILRRLEEEIEFELYKQQKQTDK